MQKITGNIGEKIAYCWLKKFGFKVILKNYHSRFGEIDLIATRCGFIYFIEVKLRSLNSFGEPKEAVVLSKQKKIVKTAMCFLSKHLVNLQPRFAVIEVFKKNGGNFSVNFLNDAFEVFDEFELFKNF